MPQAASGQLLKVRRQGTGTRQVMLAK